ncbi:MAG: ATP-binding protein, partial [Polyangiaceae bacterium]
MNIDQPGASGSNGAGPEVLAGGGDLGRRMRAIDWSSTPLGPLANWPQSLRSALSICISSRFPIAIYWGPDLALLYNDAWSPILGEKHPWALGRPAGEVWPEIWDTIGPMFRAVMTTGESTYTEDGLLPMRRYGYAEECYFNFTFTAIRGEGGYVEGIFNAVIETTYRVLAERRARLLRELGERVALASSTDDVARLAIECLVTAPADAPFAALYLVEGSGQQARLASCAGIEAGSEPAPSVIALGPDENAAWPLARAQRSLRVEVVDSLGTRFREPLPGGPWPEPASCAFVAPITLPSRDQPSAFLILGTNSRRAIDDQYTEFVEKAASQLAATLASTQRREELAAIDRAKTAFFSNVSHEFRTPLTLMLGPIDDMRALVPRDQAERERIDLLHRNALRLLKLVNTLLDFTRIEAGRVEAAYEPTDLSVLTADLASSFRSAIEKAGLTLDVDCPPLPETFHVDRDMWEKIVLNLLSNAFKFTFEGTIAVRLRKVQGGAELEVADTGIGIGEQDLPRIFGRFHRVEGARSRSHEGSGIGLALVQELVRLHGGELRVQSQQGVGSSFFLRIPSGTAHLPKDRLRAPRTLQGTTIGVGAYVQEALRWVPDPPTDSAQPLVAEPVEKEPRERILVVDDNADMRDYVSRLLRERWDVDTTSDGQAALERIRRNPPDLVLTDVMMPRLDGFGLLRALRSDASTREIPVVVLSARAGEEATSDGLKAGADDYLVKPFTARELFVRIAARLTAARAAREASAQRANLYRAFMQAPFPVGIFRGPEHVIELANYATLRAWGKGPDIKGRPLLEARP